MQPLPTNPFYCPPINLRVFDKRTFGRLPLVGLHVIKSISEYKVDQETIVQHREAIKGQLVIILCCTFEVYYIEDLI